MSNQQAAAFIKKLANYQFKDKADFLRLCSEALAFMHSSERSEIAYHFVGIVGIQSPYWEDPDIGPIIGAFADLELPDGHVEGLPDSSDFNEEEHKAFMAFAKVYVDYKWRKLAELITAMDYNLPEGFYQVIKPYLQPKPTHSYTAPALVNLWRSALDYRKYYPELQESIAKWTVSAASGSPLVDDNDLYEAIHLTFGSLEVPSEDHNIAEWQQLEQLVTEAAQKL